MSKGKVNYRFIVKISKITYPNGERRTGFVAIFDPKDQVYLPCSETLNKVLPELNREYYKLLDKYKLRCSISNQKSLTTLLNDFLVKISNHVIIKGELLKYLAEDLELKISKVREALMKTSWFKELIWCIKRDYRRIVKSNPLRYAECVCQLVYILGRDEALKVLKREGIRLGKSTINSLCRVAGETPKIKRLVEERKLKLTLAFELPRVNSKEREMIAEELSLLNYREGKEYLRIV